MDITQHALTRWLERFPGHDMECSIHRARRAGRIIRRKIKEQCKYHRHLLEGGFKGYYYTFDHSLRACFVWKSPDILVTVFKLS